MASTEPQKRDWLKTGLLGFFVASFLVTVGLPWVVPPTIEDRMRKSDPRIRQALFELLEPVALSNCTLERFGEQYDGGYLVCANLLNDVKSGYSYGISGYDGWGCDIASKLGVTVHQYDCFDTTQPVCSSGKTVFHAECIADVQKVEDGRPFGTLADHFATNGDQSRQVVLKMDVEGAEWDSLLHAPAETLNRIDQLAIELHYIDDEKFIRVVQRLKEFFYLAHLHFNNVSCAEGLEPFPAWAYEALFVSKRLSKVDPGVRPQLPHPLDALNNPTMPDCHPARLNFAPPSR
jgi:hypothetical protein